MLRERAAEVIAEKGAEILRRQPETGRHLGERERFGEVLAEVADDLLELAGLVVRAGAPLVADQPPVLRAHRHDAEQRGFHGKLTAGRLHLPRPHDLREQRAYLALAGLTGADAGVEPQPSLRERREQRKFALVGAGELEKIHCKNERAELVLPSGGTNFVQFLTGGEEHIAVRALVGVVGDGERHFSRIHGDDLELRMPVIGDKIAVIGLAAVQCGVYLERERQCAVLFFFSAGCIHSENPFSCTHCVHTLKSCYYC